MFLYLLLLFSRPYFRPERFAILRAPAWLCRFIYRIAMSFLCYIGVAAFGWIAWVLKSDKSIREARKYCELVTKE